MNKTTRPPPDFSTWNFVYSQLLHAKSIADDVDVYESAEKNDRTWFAAANGYAHPLQPAAGIEFDFFHKGVAMKAWGLPDDSFGEMSKAVLVNGQWYMLPPGEDIGVDFLFSTEDYTLAKVVIYVYDDKNKVKFEVIINR